MNIAEFDFDLPSELVAQQPAVSRTSSRLLLQATDGELSHHRFYQLPELLKEGDLLVLNDTRVYPARLAGIKETGGKVELLVERILSASRAWCFVKASKAMRAGGRIELQSIGESEAFATVIRRDADLFELEFTLPVALSDYLEQCGALPLPPYIKRQPESADRHRYQTVYAEKTGAVAAPTAGLHFDSTLLDKCCDQGIELATVTLHVGAGTFQPLRDESLVEQQLHSETMNVGEQVCQQVEQTRSRGGRIVAVGTTVVRALETAARDGQLKPFQGDTRLFLKPGDAFHVVDAMVTNFHLPKSSLLLLVSAFAGYQRMRVAYQTAISERYRFFSYGDAMLLFPPGRQVQNAREI